MAAGQRQEPTPAHGITHLHAPCPHCCMCAGNATATESHPQKPVLADTQPFLGPCAIWSNAWCCTCITQALQLDKVSALLGQGSRRPIILPHT